MGGLRRWLERFTETDAERLAAETRDWAAGIPGTTRIAEANLRERVRIAGVVRRIAVWPREGDESEYLDVIVSDGTGEVTGEFLGRRSIPGLTLGTRLILEGVLREDKTHGFPAITNPKFEFCR